MANISAVSGLDFLDDARGVATTDWDQDGDLDLWISNRTAPMVRFLRNNGDASTDPGRASVRFRLQGAHCNRDAIGARLELTVDRGKGLEKRIQTLAAGDGFLSQSSKWVHFGLGRSAGLVIESLMVRWPDGLQETFKNIEPGGRYHLVQGSGAARPVEAGARSLKLLPSPPIPQTSTVARIPMVSRLPLPEIKVSRFDGSELTLGGVSDQTLIINLWASWCAPCLSELLDFAEHAGDFEKNGIRIVALSVDQLDKQDGEAEALAIARNSAGNIDFAWANQAVIDTLESTQRTLIQGNRPLPLPSTFLVGRDGCLQVLYLGPVSAIQIVKDTEIESIDDPATRVRLAQAFSGRRRALPKSIDSMQLALKFYEGGLRSHAIDYLQQLIRIADNRGPGHQDMEVSSIHYFLGSLSEEEGMVTAAISAFEQVLRYDPGHVDALSSLARLATTSGQVDQLSPKAVEPLRLAVAHKLYQADRHREAADNMRTVLRHNPRQLTAASNLAWILATNPDASVRNGTEAVQLATMLVESTRHRDPRALDTLAAAYAEIGDFDAAVKTLEEAIDIARRQNQTKLVAEIEERLTSFRRGKPWHR